jgi:hypothetical protein
MQQAGGQGALRAGDGKPQADCGVTEQAGGHQKRQAGGQDSADCRGRVKPECQEEDCKKFINFKLNSQCYAGKILCPIQDL